MADNIPAGNIVVGPLGRVLHTRPVKKGELSTFPTQTEWIVPYPDAPETEWIGTIRHGWGLEFPGEEPVVIYATGVRGGQPMAQYVDPLYREPEPISGYRYSWLMSRRAGKEKS